MKTFLTCDTWNLSFEPGFKPLQWKHRILPLDLQGSPWKYLSDCFNFLNDRKQNHQLSWGWVVKYWEFEEWEVWNSHLREWGQLNKDLHYPDNHDGLITHLEPDILECEVKWALESITTNKASGGDGIPIEIFQILKDDAVKVLHSICQQIWKTQQWPQDWKDQFSFQTQRKAIPKNARTTAKLHSSHMLVN